MKTKRNDYLLLIERIPTYGIRAEYEAEWADKDTLYWLAHRKACVSDDLIYVANREEAKELDLNYCGHGTYDVYSGERIVGSRDRSALIHNKRYLLLPPREWRRGVPAEFELAVNKLLEHYAGCPNKQLLPRAARRAFRYHLSQRGYLNRFLLSKGD